MRDTYGHAFVLLGLAWYYRLTKDAQIRAIVDSTLAFVDEGLASQNGGYVDAVPAPDAIRRQNPHMHLFEACLALYEALEDPQHLTRAAAIFDLFAERFFQPATGTLCEYFTAELQAGCRGRPARSWSRDISMSGSGFYASSKDYPGAKLRTSHPRSINLPTCMVGTITASSSTNWMPRDRSWQRLGARGRIQRG